MTSGSLASKGNDANAVRISGSQNVLSLWNVVAPKIPPDLRMRLASGHVSSVLRSFEGDLPARTEFGSGMTWSARPRPTCVKEFSGSPVFCISRQCLGIPWSSS